MRVPVPLSGSSWAVFDTLGKDPQGNEVIMVSGTPTTTPAGELLFLTVSGRVRDHETLLIR